MCGIVGFSKPGLSERQQAETITAMSASLVHRGPDDHGQWHDCEAAIALGHRRLSIIDVSPLGHQPMVSRSGRYVIVYNGEIYNFLHLRKELADAGAEFRGGSDTEVMLAAIETWGLPQAVSRFAGMFAFAVWDRELRNLSLVRDRLGIKPLYWGRIGNLFLFGSELSALLACPGWPREVDRDSLAAYTRWNYIPSPHSIYRHVKKLEPGTILNWRQGEAPRIERFWDVRDLAGPQATEDRQLDDETAARSFEKLLRGIVAEHMISDVPLGAFLSGGIDSSLVVAMMQAQSNQPVRTFSVGFAEARYNEAEHAKAVADHLGTDHTEVYLDDKQALDLVPELPRHYDEPFADSSQLPTCLIASITRQQVTVALSGDGGDELFAGYTRYRWAEHIWRRFGWLPLNMRKGLAGAIQLVPRPLWSVTGALLPTAFGEGRLAERAAKFAQYVSVQSPDGIYHAQHTHWPSPCNLVINGQEAVGRSCDAALTEKVPDFVARMQIMDTLQYLPDDILTKVDRATMAVSLEARVPLLDHRLVEFAWGLPAKLKYRDGRSKWLLRRVLDDYVPRSLIDRPKSGFAAPIATWLRGPLREWAEELLEPRRLAREGYFNPEPLSIAWRRFLAGQDELREPLWGILMFQAWLQERPAACRAFT